MDEQRALETLRLPFYESGRARVCGDVDAMGKSTQWVERRRGKVWADAKEGDVRPPTTKSSWYMAASLETWNHV